MKIVKSSLQTNTSTEHEFVLFVCQYFLHNLVKYCLIFKILDNFQLPTERTVEKCKQSKSSFHYEMRNWEMNRVELISRKLWDFFQNLVTQIFFCRLFPYLLLLSGDIIVIIADITFILLAITVIPQLISVTVSLLDLPCDIRDS